MALQEDGISHCDSLDAEWSKLKPDEVEDAAATPQKAQGKAKAKAAPKSSTKTRKNALKHCRGCRKKMNQNEFATNWPGCWPCKRALDNITKLAARQGEAQKKFVSKARADKEQCYHMISSYMEKCPEASDGSSSAGRKRGTWSLVKYVERVSAASGLVKDKIGEMMFHKLYLEFAGTIRGGRKSEAEAEAIWRQWEVRVTQKDSEMLFDYLGPNGQLRIWVHTQDMLTYRSQYMHEKEVTCEGESKKKGTDEDVDRFRSEILSKHGTGASMCFDEVAHALATNGEDAFTSTGGFITDVMDLKAETETEEVVNPEGGEGPECQERDPKKQRLWVDRDKTISSTMRAVKSQQDAFRAKAVAQYDRQSKYLKELKDTADETFKKDFFGEIDTLEVRLEALKLVLGNEDQKLKAFVGRFSGSDLAEGAVAPPCEDYAKLRPMNEADSLIENYRKCSTPSQLQAGFFFEPVVQTFCDIFPFLGILANPRHTFFGFF